VLVVGETGSGKELLARTIHLTGARGSFVAINCAAIPSELLEAELFGVQRRVATGVDPRQGLFLRANGGSMFLDEIGEMPERLQVKILRVLQEREILPIGASHPIPIELRVIAASNRDLGRLVREGTFRADLYYRLRGIELRVPPLRERSDDIPQLALHFLECAAADYNKRVTGITRKALDVLRAHDWPGNVRELESDVRHAVLVCPTGSALDSQHFARSESGAADIDRAVRPLQEAVNEIERREIERALSAAGGNKSRAARLLGITRNGLALKLRRLRIRDK
jgi:transcriptional regulator with PAS, ATPase and Fis domain